MRRIEYMKEEHLSQVVDLWAEAFGDDKNYIEIFLAFQIKDRFSYIVSQEGAVIGMSHVFPCEIHTPKGDYKFAYIYAVATRSSHRKQGIAKEMMHFIQKDLKKKNYHGIFLFPADESLFSYYQKIGFRTHGYERKRVIQYEWNKENPQVEPLEDFATILKDVVLFSSDRIKDNVDVLARRIRTLKAERFENYCYESIPEIHQSFILYDNALSGRKMIFFKYGDSENYLIYEYAENVIRVYEICISKEDFIDLERDIVDMICHVEGISGREFLERETFRLSFEFTLPMWFCIGELEAKAMILSEEERFYKEDFLFFPVNRF